MSVIKTLPVILRKLFDILKMDKVRQKVEISENFEIIGSSEKNIRRY